MYLLTTTLNAQSWQQTRIIIGTQTGECDAIECDDGTVELITACGDVYHLAATLDELAVTLGAVKVGEQQLPPLTTG